MVSITTNQALNNMHLGMNEQVELYRLLVESVQDYAIFMLDPHGNVASWNKGAQKLKGYKPNEIIGRHFSNFYPQVDRDNKKPEWELEQATKFGRVEDEGWRVKKDGSRFWANVVITALRDEKGTLVGFAKVTRDLTERKSHEDAVQQANRQLRQQATELEMLNRSKDEFVSLASHQLRTPATGVKQFLGLVLEGYAGELTAAQREFLEKAYESNNRQIDLVNNLLRVAQVDAGKVVLDPCEVELSTLLRDVIDEQKDAFTARNQKVTIRKHDGPTVVEADQPRLRMVLENLIDNAGKYTPPGGTISVSIAKGGGTYIISIKDTGVGIDEESLAKLFVKFTRIQNELSDIVGGSGLGLYWANKIVQLHGGEIRVTSTQGKGSTFSVHLPIKAHHG